MPDYSESTAAEDMPSNPPHEPQGIREPDAMAEDQPREESPAEQPPAPPPPEPLKPAEPGVYRCVAEIAGEHAVLGVMTEGQEYDYSRERNPLVLQSVAAYVELGVLEKKG